MFQWLIVDCLLAFFLSRLARPVWTTGLGTLNNEETSREASDGFPSVKVSIPGFGWDELVLLWLCSHVALERNVGISVVSFDRRRAVNHSLDAWQVSPTRNERRKMNDELRMPTSKG